MAVSIPFALLGHFFFTAYEALGEEGCDRFQRRNAALGYLAHAWAWCVERREAGFCAHEDFVDTLMGAGTHRLLVAHGFIVGGGDDQPRWTGPDLESDWLGGTPRQTIVTYVVQRGDDGPVKIGRARDLTKRMESLQTGCAESLSVLRTIRGDHEKVLHAACAPFRLRGEWFAPSPEFFAALGRAVESL